MIDNVFHLIWIAGLNLCFVDWFWLLCVVLDVMPLRVVFFGWLLCGGFGA